MPAPEDHVKALLEALEAVRRGWNFSTAPTELWQEWLSETRTMIRNHGKSWTDGEVELVCAELNNFAVHLRENPDEYSWDTSPISYNTNFAEHRFPELNTLWDTYGHERQNTRRRRSLSPVRPTVVEIWSIANTAHVGRGELTKYDGILARLLQTDHGSAREHSLPHSARYPEQYKLRRLRPF